MVILIKVKVEQLGHLVKNLDVYLLAAMEFKLSNLKAPTATMDL